MSVLLDVRSIAKHYAVSAGLLAPRRTVKAVDGVSFQILAGRTLGLVGESGCGKSTTARLALGLVPATSGTVVYDGAVLPSLNTPEWRRLRQGMQLVHQDPLGALDRRIAVGRQVMEPLVVHSRPGKARDHRAKAFALFEAVGLGAALFDRYPHELSGGQRQRVVLARALILDPRLLVCDEPVSALDVSVQAQVLNLLQDLQARLGLTYLFISHDLRVVRQVADEIAIMYLGRIVEQGPPEAVLHAPRHPYTQALVSAMPSPRHRRGERIVLEGDPPSPIDVPDGCPFHPRCPRAVDRCRHDRPALRVVAAGVSAACHLVEGTVL